MPILSQKRQITLPKELCDKLAVRPGDDLDILEHRDRITIIKKHKGSSDGLLKGLKADEKYSDAESLHDALSRKHSGKQTRKRTA